MIATDLARINVACGTTPIDGFVNVDIRDVGDVVHDCLQPLPFADGSASMIRVDDFLEHVPPDLQDQVVADWRRVLAPGGELQVRVPNLHAIATELVRSKDRTWLTLLIRNIYGGHRWGDHGEFDCHHAGWTPDLLAAFLDDRGFRVVGNDLALNMTVTAVKKEPT